MWFVTHMSWCWAFYVTLPIALRAVAGAFWFVDEGRDPAARPGYDPPGVAAGSTTLARPRRPFSA